MSWVGILQVTLVILHEMEYYENTVAQKPQSVLVAPQTNYIKYPTYLQRYTTCHLPVTNKKSKLNMCI